MVDQPVEVSEQVAQQEEPVKESMKGKLIELKVGNTTNPKNLAGSIVKNYQEGRVVKTIAIGAAAVNQSLKGMAIARSILTTQGESEVYLIPGWADIEIGGEKKSAITLKLIVK